MSPAFYFASPDERTLDAGAYLLGSLELALIAGPLALAAFWVRRALLPAWTGAPARVVESILWLTALLWLGQLLGTFAAFESWTMIAGSLVLCGAAWWVAGRRDAPEGGAAPPVPEASRLATWLAAVACAVVAAAWMVPTLGSLAGGMDRADTLWYHMPLAARFADGAHFGGIDHFDPIFFASYYPANSEVFHAIPLLTYDRDILSPLLNLGWLALGLLASYAIGRPYGVGPQALIGGAIALGAENLVEFQAGEALNDIVGVSLLLAAVAVLVNAHEASRNEGSVEGPVPGEHQSAAKRAVRRGPAPRRSLPVSALAVAGLASGLAAGTKLSFLAPVFALWAGLIVISRGARIRAALWFGVPAFLAGGYWFVRNLVAVGNPIPYTSFGPLGLPAPERSFELRPGYSVAHYLTDLDIWWNWFFPGFDSSFGFLWPAVMLAFLGAGAYALWRGADPMVRMLGAVVLFTAIAYVFTPLTAAGEEGEPIAFDWNVRYLAPASAIGLALLPCLRVARRSELARDVTLAGLCVLFAVTVGSLVQWQQGHVKGAVATGVAVICGFALIQWGRRRHADPWPAAWVAGLAAVLVVGALGAGWWEQRHYLERRYENLSPQLKLAEAARWARDLRDAKVAVSGVRGVFNQYVFYGTDLSNYVQWLGVEGDDGAFLRIPTCEEWRAELAAGGYTHVVTTYDPFNPFNPDGLTDTKEALWTRKDPGSKQLLRDGPVAVFELNGPPDPDSCGDLPDLSASELNGDSVNADPTANQP